LSFSLRKDVKKRLPRQGKTDASKQNEKPTLNKYYLKDPNNKYGLFFYFPKALKT
jgi:hypothetical protein